MGVGITSLWKSINFLIPLNFPYFSANIVHKNEIWESTALCARAHEGITKPPYGNSFSEFRKNQRSENKIIADDMKDRRE
jgi:hypothetical protein